MSFQNYGDWAYYVVPPIWAWDVDRWKATVLRFTKLEKARFLSLLDAPELFPDETEEEEAVRLFWKETWEQLRDTKSKYQEDVHIDGLGYAFIGPFHCIALDQGGAKEHARRFFFACEETSFPLFGESELENLLALTTQLVQRGGFSPEKCLDVVVNALEKSNGT